MELDIDGFGGFDFDAFDALDEVLDVFEGFGVSFGEGFDAIGIGEDLVEVHFEQSDARIVFVLGICWNICMAISSAPSGRSFLGSGLMAGVGILIAKFLGLPGLNSKVIASDWAPAAAKGLGPILGSMAWGFWSSLRRLISVKE